MKQLLAGAVLWLAAHSPAEAEDIIGVQSIAITVSDIDATVAFYERSLPYQVVDRFQVPARTFPRQLVHDRHGNVDIAIVRTPTVYLQLMDFNPGQTASPNPIPVIGPGYTHICFQSPSTAPAIRRFKSNGLSIISRFADEADGVDIGGYGVRYAYGRDPDGIMIENESLDRPQRPEAAWVSHIANTVHDRDAMLAFYEHIFGRKPFRTIEQDNRPKLDDVADINNLSIKGGWFNLGNIEIEVWQYVRPETPQPTARRKLDDVGYSGFDLEVGDLTAQSARMKKIGVEFVGKPIVLGRWRVQYAHDPEGNIFALRQAIGGYSENSVAGILLRPN